MNQRGIGLSGVMMAALGALLGLREVGARLGELTAGAAAFAGGPTPRALDWIAGVAAPQTRLAAMAGWLGLAAGLLAITLAWRLLVLLNPSGTLVASDATERDQSRPWLQTPLTPSLLRRAAAAAGVTLYLLGGLRLLFDGDEAVSPPSVWGLTGLVVLWPSRPWVGWSVAFLLGGAALWLLWGEWGAITPRRRPSGGVIGTLARGLLAGAAAVPALFPVTPLGRGLLGAILAARGLADSNGWRLALISLTIGLPLAFLALGVVGHVLSRPGAGRPARAWLAALFLALLGGVEAWWFADALRRYDVGRDLAALVGAPRGASSARSFLLFPPETAAPLAGRVPLMSIEGIAAGDESARHTWEYLLRRRFQSAAVWHALVHLHDCASLRWDSAESLRVDLASLEHNPQPVFADLLAKKLATCATNTENHALLRRAADPSRFRPDREWLRTLGLLHHRFGDQAAASEALRRAGMTPTEVHQALGLGAPVTTGAASGQIEVDGQPGAGLLVGLLPAGHWQTLVGAPAPFELRWVAAAAPTDAEGRFRLRDLGEGEYVLIVMGDPAHLPIERQGARVTRAPGLLRLDARHPSRDLGTLRIVTRERPAPAASVAGAT